MAISYEEMLKQGKEALPSSIEKTERFEIPKVRGHVQGNKVVISNYIQICNDLRREPTHLLKFLQRELATPAEIEGPRLVLGRKLSSALINSKIEQYANLFVLCQDCKKPDTKLIKEERFLFIKCTACGAKHPVRAKI